MRIITSLVATLGLLVPVGGVATTAVVVSGCEPSKGGKAKETTDQRYDPDLSRTVNICLGLEHLDSNDKSDPDHKVTESRAGHWQTGGRAPNCVVEVQREGKTKDGKEPPWETVATGNNAHFTLVDGVHRRFRALGCGPRNYDKTAGYGVFHIECHTNQWWGAHGKHK